MKYLVSPEPLGQLSSQFGTTLPLKGDLRQKNSCFILSVGLHVLFLLLLFLLSSFFPLTRLLFLSLLVHTHFISPSVPFLFVLEQSSSFTFYILVSDHEGKCLSQVPGLIFFVCSDACRWKCCCVFFTFSECTLALTYKWLIRKVLQVNVCF